MATNHNNLIYALKDGAIMHISEVERGLKCGCTCPACGENLIARKGRHRIPHFAHQTIHDCEYGYETSLHLAAKEILSKLKRMVIPAVYIHFPNPNKKMELISEAREITIDRVELERRCNKVIPDVVVYAGGKRLFVEIFVTHRVDDDKLDKLTEMDLSTIEIDLSQIDDSISKEKLTTLLTEDSLLKYWKYNSEEMKWLEMFRNASDMRSIAVKEGRERVYGCPIDAQTWHNKRHYTESYADFRHDCLECQYCISYSFEGGMLCSGKKRISSIRDFDIPEKTRLKDSDDVLDDLREMAIVAGNCPYCGGRLERHIGKYGSFLGCENYPDCRFTKKVDENSSEWMNAGRRRRKGTWVNPRRKINTDSDANSVIRTDIVSDEIECSEPEPYSIEIECENTEVQQQTAELDYMTRYDEVKDQFTQQETEIHDSTGRRWIQCECCGKIGEAFKDFGWWGGRHRVNLGKCWKCIHPDIK